jgi:hypothetical protein
MWIKVRTELRHSPKVVMIASRMGVTNVTALGAIVHAWMIADGHADDEGFIEHLSFETLNNMVGIEKLAEAMADVGWIKEVTDGLQFIDYKEHNGSTGKTRAQNQKRQARARKNAVTAKRDEMNTRGEERKREEKREEVEEVEEIAYPTTSTALVFAKETFPKMGRLRLILSSTDDIVERWHLDRSSNGWLTRYNNPISDWRADLKLFAERWASRHADDMKKQPAENYMPKL